MKVGDLVGIKWSEGIGYVGSARGKHVGLVLKKATLCGACVVYCPTLQTFDRIKVWDKTWLVRLSDEV